MAFTESWVESDPDGAVITGSLLDDYQRQAKRALRERLEGDPADLNSGIFESGSFAGTAIVRAGTARTYTTTLAGLAALTKQDGRLAIVTDESSRLYHLAAAGDVPVSAHNPYILTIGTHLTGGTYDGSGAVTIATDATNLDVGNTIVARDVNGAFSMGALTASGGAHLFTGNGFTVSATTSIFNGTAVTISAITTNITSTVTNLSGATVSIGKNTGFLGFYGSSGHVIQVLATGAGHTVDDVITALQTVNLVKQA